MCESCKLELAGCEFIWLAVVGWWLLCSLSFSQGKAGESVQLIAVLACVVLLGCTEGCVGARREVFTSILLAAVKLIGSAQVKEALSCSPCLLLRHGQGPSLKC